MAKDAKFGTFGGVFTPSILTILGVIMYLRLPWVVGQAGLWVAVAIIGVSHVISLTTGLSISSIATDKNVGAGGPYYIVSRSLGLPIGGTLGLALFVGLAFSISLYVIGFCESFLSVLSEYVPQVEVTPNAIRVAGTLTIVGLAIITLISTALAIKTQYIILTFIGVSLVVIVVGWGNAAPDAAPQLQPVEGGASIETLFGIFFPAVTGFTAGVNMSGDLRNPKKSIPLGTMASILTGMAVYFGLAVFLAYRVETAALVDDTDVLSKIALWGPAVIAGVWGATLSSALGSLLGAPRILQALSIDRITPKFFAKGAGRTNEPRNALLLAFAIGEGGILIAELDVIARVVSMVFLATYGFLNISCAIESWASPDFRPEFRIPRTVSIAGAVTCILVMIQLDLAAMAGATVLMTTLFLYLKRKQLHLDAGDTWEGIWSSIVRAGLHRLSQSDSQRRNWRPNVLLFSRAQTLARGPQLDLATSLITGNGLLTDFELLTPGTKNKDVPPDDEEPPVGVFHRRTPVEDFYDTVAGITRHHGFSGIDPNTVMFDWAEHRTNPERFISLLQSTQQQDLNLLLLAYDGDRGFGEYRSIDVWWRAGQGNVALGLALVRFLTRFEPWNGATVRFLLVSDDSAHNDALRAAMRGALAEARVEATIKVVTVGSRDDGFRVAIRQESDPASLTIVGLPEGRIGERDIAGLDELQQQIGTVLFLRGSSLFPEVLPVPKQVATRVSSVYRTLVAVPDLRMPDHVDLIREIETFSDQFEGMVNDVYDDGIAQALAQEAQLVDRVGELIERQFEMLRRGVAETERARAKKPASRAQGGFLFQARKLLSEFEEEQLPAQRAALEGRIEAFMDRANALRRECPRILRVTGRTSAFRPHPDDSPRLRRFKRRRRILSSITRRPVSYQVPLQALQSHYLRSDAPQLLHRNLAQFESNSHRTAVSVGKLLNAATTDLSEIQTGLETGEIGADDIEKRKERVVSNLDACRTMVNDLGEELRHTMMREARGLVQALADDLHRIDLWRFVGKERKPPKRDRIEADRERIAQIIDGWFTNQGLLLHRANLGLLIASFQSRFTTIALRAKAEVALEIRNSVLGELQSLLEQLRELHEDIKNKKSPEVTFDQDLRARFDSQAALDRFTRDIESCTEELPDTSTTLSDEVIGRLESGVEVEVEELSISVRPLIKFLLESEFIGIINQELAGIPMQEQRAAGTAHDVTRLIEFSMADLDAMGGWRNEAFRAQVLSVVHNGVARLEDEVAVLQASAEGFEARVDQQLRAMIEGTNPYALTSHTESLGQYIRSRGSQQAVSRLRELARKGFNAVKAGFVAALYRRSAGLLLARRLGRREHGRDSVVDRSIRLATQSTPSDRVLRTLPFYYRQLYSGQATISETFWVGRQEELENIRYAVRAHGNGAHGALFVIGQTGSGKTALCQVAVNMFLSKRKVYRIQPPRGGSIDPQIFRRAFEAEVKQKGNYDRLFRSIPDGSVFVLDDLELWWERTDEKMAILRTVLDLVEKHGDRVLFIANINHHAWRLINRFVHLNESALAVVGCDPLSAEDLKSIITLRHGSTGMKFRLDRVDEDDLPPWRQARLFTRYFDISGGVVGAALRSWLAHIDKVDHDTLVMRWPTTPDTSAIDDLRVEHTAILVQLILHKQVTMQRLERITGLGSRLQLDVDRLVRMGLVRRDSQGNLHIDRFVAHFVTDRMRDLGYLP